MDSTGIKRLETDVYNISSRPNGYVLLINIETFENGGKQQRFGSMRDYKMLKEMWENFGYRVKEYCNLKLKDFEAAVKDFASMPDLARVDSAVVFVMSHGKEDERNPQAVLISTSDNGFISSDWIKNRFTASNCSALVGKPKVLFFQACRGILHDRGVPFSQANFMNAGLQNKLVPVISDLLIVYPTLPGYVSQRNTVLGAMFVQECIAVFKQDWAQADLLTMLNKVDNRIRQKCGSNGILFQVLYFESWGFNKKMYFHSKQAKDKNKGRKYSDNFQAIMYPTNVL